MSHDPTLAAFLRLRAFSGDEAMSPLDRLSTEAAAAWLAHATSYGITADTKLLRDIADPGRHPVARAKTLTLTGYSTACGHLFHAHVASHSMTCGHPGEVICEAVYS
jgi:hypothetical protein